MTSSEISQHMTENDARLITGYIRNLIASVTEKIDEIGKMLTKAYDRRAWVALGYESWDAYVSAELRTDRMRLDRDDRQELVVQLRSAGMSTRAIGSAVGTSDYTVREDLKAGARNHAPEPVTGTDGKTYPSSPPVRDEPLLDGEDERRTAPAGSDTPRARDLPQADPPAVEELGPPAPSAAVSEFVDSDPELQRERYMLAFAKALGRSDDFMEFDPDKLGDLADPELVESLDNYLTRVRNFVDRFHRARRGLQVIQGGRK